VFPHEAQGLSIHGQLATEHGGMADLPWWWVYPLLALLGGTIGTYGTLIGAGGGIFLVPTLLLLYSRDSPNAIASISLAVVFFNAASGTLAYARMGRIDYRAGLLFAMATVPGAVLGAYATSLLSRRLFDLILSGLILTLAAVIILRPAPRAQPIGMRRYALARRFTDANGVDYDYAFSTHRGVGLSFLIGCVSSMLGIGGGAFHVPMLVYLLHFPLHVATATSHFTLAIMSLFGSITHVAMGDFSHGIRRTLALGVGVLVGAQLGALLSQRVRGITLIRILALGLVLFGIRLVIQAVQH
jgi:uncharacterized membrane protein YfcA